ncbi:dihydroorotase [Prolixibacteraceae bacterium JC049]|nr:dihydroorotase [Prolixibacteraceae bacterium JC049]
MKMKTLIKNATVINEGRQINADVLLHNNIIEQISEESLNADGAKIIDATGKWLIPGVIDDQVHFREPGLTRKADILSESRAAVAGGVTSFMEMPNTNPQTTNQQELQAKYDRAADVSAANYSFYIGATNDNLDEILKTDPKTVCGVKVFMGSSTGNMLVDKDDTLTEIFRNSPTLVATHCEDEATIQHNTTIFKEKYGENVPIESHPLIRSAEACYKSSAKAVELASKHGTRLHVLHLSSAKEMELFQPGKIADKKITGEICVHHMWFNSNDYKKYGTRIKWNPAVKAESDRAALVQALNDDRLDVVATDHAPHTLEEKDNTYFKAPSGGPLVQHSLVAMVEMSKKGYFTIEKVVEKMCHAPAELFQIHKRGFIREGYYADLVLVDPNKEWDVTPNNILYKCQWSPFEGSAFTSKVTHTFINGKLAYENGQINKQIRGERLIFDR